MMKKTTIKSKASPAPATKTAAAPKSAKPAKSAATKASTLTTAQATAGLAALAAKAVTGRPAITLIVAQVDVGFGNALYLRGDGAGLSWDKGAPMTCVANDRWEIALESAAQPFAVKFLINDTTWSTGADYTVQPGATVTLQPSF